MGRLAEKTKYFLDWMQHGYLIVQVLISIGLGKALKAILVTYTHMPPVWITPLWLLASALMMALLVFIGNQLRKRQGQGGSLTQTERAVSLVASTANLDATVFFRQSYYSPLQSEVEANIRAAAIQNQPNDRESFYIKFIGIGLIAYLYDVIWFAIYKSQLLSLLELNRRNGLMPLADVKVYYDQAVITYPAAYAHYSFDEWLSFMKNQVLIIWHPSDMVEITLRGKDFLKYLLHWGREANQRTL
jgi:hypothetical protein